MTVPQSTLQRVRKLLALSESTNEAESAAAMAAARRLMAQHEITIEEVNSLPGDKPEMAKRNVENGHNDLWEHMLAAAIAENFGCYNYYTGWRGSKKATHHYAGRAADADMCVYAHINLAEQMRRMANRAWTTKALGRTRVSRGK